MAERQYDENPDPESRDQGSDKNGSGREPDLRSLMHGGTRRRTVAPEPPQPPPGSEDGLPDRPENREFHEEAEEKLPPVWPGDQNQPWFRRERGLPPLPERGERPPLDPEDLPTQLAEISTRARAFGLMLLLPQVLGIIPVVGFYLGTIPLVINLILYRQGQDIGAVVFGLRVVRDNGEVAGFFHMFVRNAASAISLLALGAGFWTAFSDPERRTWHDKWLKTYVVKDSAEYKTRKRSSSETAFNWFWIIILLTIAILILLFLSSVPPAENMPPE